jgi:hypothetical protein
MDSAVLLRIMKQIAASAGLFQTLVIVEEQSLATGLLQQGCNLGF